MKVSIQNITPVMAAEFLENNKSNRKINKKQLEMIVRSIEADKWRLTHQGVAFYDDGELADGQHRLQAIVKTGRTLKMPVFTGIERDIDTILAIDCGKGRTVIDSASISGINIKPSDISVVKGIEYGYASKAFKKLSHSESCDLCTKYFNELQNINTLFPKSKPFITLAPVKVAVIDSLSSGVSMEVAKKFCDALVSGEYSESIFVNAVRLRSKLISKNYNGGGDRVIAYNMTYNTLIKTQKGEQVKRIIENKLIK
ncbi:MAG: hypothetical protein GY920_21545 [Aliivibrio sp.]|nr:hypothetical protein [Aliivibrio sp.]MCP4255871.1 hypothetical protein [Candidatus Scalindua sp.]|tara:strand:- start:67 stop:834 length:768 start_codon:yes stop_codon:yes gene_type:complete